MAIHSVDVAKSAVHIDPQGHLTISDPKVVDLLKAQKLGTAADLNKAAVSVGVVVSF